VSHASSSSKIKKENKINIKSKTLNKRKEKLLVSKAFHNRGESNVQGQANLSDCMAPPYVGYAHNTQPQVPTVNSGISSFSYEELQPGIPDLWDGHTNLISMFSQIALQEIDVNNIKISLSCISNFISNRELKSNREDNILFLKGFGQVTFDFVSSVFKGGWDQLKTDNNRIFCKLIKNKFTIKVLTSNKGKKTFNSPLSKPVNFSKLPLFQLLPRPSKEVLVKSKFHGKNTPSKIKKVVETSKLSYAQISLKNIDTILKIKENLPELSHKKIKQINKSIFNILDKPKPRINMTTKGLS